ncbi:SGNH/GDSL hydrolase family protein [Actinokineospora enzanensis]|uniref:SGNH/GDSL hydrolase family protein n=1 Tax=Actinokineospora enzanensis TaxID=155975 RepID=UPI000365C95B|nr:SGNH/GDSL hydrolase family protein [Actinokineospora enzanensis]
MSRVHIRLTAVVAAVVAGFGVVVPTASAAPVRQASLQWVAFGDSYAAGAIPAAGVEVSSGGQRDGCVRTVGSYPEVLRQRWEGKYDLTNVSCAGATIANVLDEEQVPNGYNLPFFDVVDPDYPFTPVPPQISALSESTNLVTVGIGGNTFGFAELLYACLQLGEWADEDADAPCKDYFTSGADGVPTVDERLTQVSEQFGELLAAIQANAPGARILVVGYPKIIPDDPGTCVHGTDPAALKNFATATRPDLVWLRTDVLERLNLVLAMQAQAHSARYVDTYAISTGHDVCQPDGKNWVEGITDRSGGWSLVHPNSRGHAAIADAIQAVAGS